MVLKPFELCIFCRSLMRACKEAAGFFDRDSVQKLDSAVVLFTECQD